MDIFGEAEPVVKPVSPIPIHQKVQDLGFLPLDFPEQRCLVEPVSGDFRLARPGLEAVRYK
jgi:hypothetical protein